MVVGENFAEFGKIKAICLHTCILVLPNQTYISKIFHNLTMTLATATHAPFHHTSDDLN